MIEVKGNSSFTVGPVAAGLRDFANSAYQNIGNLHEKALKVAERVQEQVVRMQEKVVGFIVADDSESESEFSLPDSAECLRNLGNSAYENLTNFHEVVKAGVVSFFDDADSRSSQLEIPFYDDAGNVIQF